MKFRFAVLLLAASRIAMAADQYTAEDQRALDSLKAEVQGGCEQQMVAMKAKITDRVAPLVRFMTAVTQSVDYCSCTVQKLDEKMTPAILRRASGTEIGQLAKISGTECILPVFKSTFGSFCADLLHEIKGAAKPETVPGPETCRCIQEEIDQVTVDSYEEYVRRSILDYKEYQRTRVIPATTGPSLLTRMYSCGLDRVKKKD